jgi:DNA-binding SARP family transcriptional activator/predicted ATPase/class 3 adenylate cyclase
MARFTIRLFGYPQLLIKGSPVKLDRRKTLALAAYLAVETAGFLPKGNNQTNPSCTRDVLAALLWPDRSQEQAASYLRQALWDLSKHTGDEWLSKDNQTIAFNSQADIWVDVNHFEAGCMRIKTGECGEEESFSLLTELADLYQADFLSGFWLRECPEFDAWQTFQAETLRLHLGQVLDWLSHVELKRMEYDQASMHTRRWLELDWLNEAAHRRLMQLYAQNGQPNAAARQYEICRDRLMEELGVEPSEETTTFLKQIRSHTTGFNRSQAGQKGGEKTQKPSLGAGNPSGTVTFLFTDIEGSTYLWEHYPTAMQSAFHRQEVIIRECMAAHGGYVYKMIGDAFQVAFATAPAALSAALAAQRVLQAEPWGEIGTLKVRMALHTGMTEEREDDYIGPDLNRVARVLNAGYGGQVLLTQPTYELVRGHLPNDAKLLDLGEHILKDLVYPEHIYQLKAPELIDKFPPLKTIDSHLVHLPFQTTPFIGREEELAKISRLLENPDCRLITLVGIGGSGKTRLAIQAAANSHHFSNGAFFVGLVFAHSREEIIQTIADACKLTFRMPLVGSLPFDEAHAQLMQFLAGKQLLLVLDNFEHLTAWADGLIDLMDAGPGIKLIVTSRELLNLRGEWVVEVSGLSFPGQQDANSADQFASVQLFIHAAERTSGFKAGPTDWEAITRICQLLEGIPLGVEMAAAWTKVLSCQEIEAEMERNLDFLSATWRGMPERQQTLRAVFEYSWRLLNDKERDSFMRLSVFTKGFSREAALETAGTSLSGLISLVDKTLIRRVSSQWFEIHPLLKQYAAEKLAASPMILAETYQRQAAYYTEWLGQMHKKFRGSDQLAALVTLRNEVSNLRSVWQRMVKDRDVTRLQRMMPTLILYYIMNNRRIETRGISEFLLDLVDYLRPAAGEAESVNPELLALTLAALRHFSFETDDRASSIEYQKECLKILPALPDDQDKAYSMLLITTGASWLASHEAAEMCDQATEIFTRLGDDWGAGMAQIILADAYNFGSFNHVQARKAYQASLDFFTQSGNDWGRALCWIGLMNIELQAGNLPEAYRLGCDSLEILELYGNKERKLWIQDVLGDICERWGKYEEAHRFYEANLAYFREVGDLEQQKIYQEILARVASQTVR